MSQCPYFENIKLTVVSKCLPLVFLSSTVYAFSTEAKINFENLNKGKITRIILPLGKVSSAMSLRSGSF